MSFFSWFTRKSPPARPRVAGPSGSLRAASPILPARGNGVGSDPSKSDNAAIRSNERMERRELLYVVVRDAMVRAGVLSASYKFKVLSLDPRGHQFLVMMDLASEYGGETARLGEMEALIAQSAKLRYDITVSAVYWRISDQVAAGMASKGAAPQGAGLKAASAVQRPPVQNIPASAASVAPVSVPAAGPVLPAAMPARPPLEPVNLMAPRFDPIEADEVAAFKRALAAAAAARAPVASAPGVAVRSGGRPVPAGSRDFADTEMPEQDSRAQTLSSTQYGDL